MRREQESPRENRGRADERMSTATGESARGESARPRGPGLRRARSIRKRCEPAPSGPSTSARDPYRVRPSRCALASADAWTCEWFSESWPCSLVGGHAARCRYCSDSLRRALVLTAPVLVGSAILFLNPSVDLFAVHLDLG